MKVRVRVEVTPAYSYNETHPNVVVERETTVIPDGDEQGYGAAANALSTIATDVTDDAVSLLRLAERREDRERAASAG